MRIVMTIFFLISALLFFGAFSYLAALKRPGVYPPRHVIRKRAVALAGGGAIFLLAASMLSLF